MDKNNFHIEDKDYIHGRAVVEKNNKYTQIDLYNDKDNKMFAFRVDSEEKERTLKFTMHPENATSVDEILFMLDMFDGMKNGTIVINGVNVFDKWKDGVKSVERDDIEGMRKYWERVKALEELLEVKFKLKIPMSEDDAYTLEMLCVSLLDDKPVKINNPNKLSFSGVKKKSLDSIVGETSDFKFLQEKITINLLETEIKDLSKIFFCGPIKIIGYDITSDTPLSVQLKLEKNDNTVTAVKFFRSVEEARLYIKDKDEYFRKAKKIWES